MRPAIGAHRIFVRPAIAALTVSPATTELTVRPCHCGAHSKAMPSGAYYDQPRSLTINISSKKIFLEI